MIMLNKYNKNRKQCQKEKQTRKSFEKLYRKGLQDNLIFKSENKSLGTVFLEFLDETKNESFY